MQEFIIFKNTKPNDNPKAPTHRVMATINNELVEIGGGWSRESKTGNKFLSIRLKSPYKDKNGYSIKYTQALFLFPICLINRHDGITTNSTE